MTLGAEVAHIRVLRRAQAQRTTGLNCPSAGRVRPPRTHVETLRPYVMRDRAHLERMLALLYAGAVRPPTIVRYKLADASEAHRLSESRHLQGESWYSRSAERCSNAADAAEFAQLKSDMWHSS
jgi:Zinc-binding dehydrogenase